MPTYARTNTPLPRINVKEAYEYKVQSGATTNAIAGNGQGVTSVPAEDSSTFNYGYVWVRLKRGVGANGEILTSPPQKAIASKDFYIADGMPIKVSTDPVTGYLRIEGNDTLGASAGGLNTNGVNAQAPVNRTQWLRQIRNLRPFSPTSNTTSSTTISIEPYLYIVDGTVKLAEKGQSDAIDLVSYIPTAGNERLVGLALKTSDNTIQIVSGTARTISNAGWSVADLQELVDGFDTDAMPIFAYHLKDAQTAITEQDRRFDLRQFINIAGGSGTVGYPNPVTTNYVITDGHTLLVDSGWVIDAGASVTLGTGSAVVVVDSSASGGQSPIQRSVTAVSADYSALSTDSIITVDASGGDVTITLPNATTNDGLQLDIKAIDVSGGSVTIDTTSSQTIDGLTSQLISTQYDSVTVLSDGSNWIIL